jgi:putative hydrolase of the HAD superfamily
MIQPEIIFFDAAGTLLELRGSVGDIYADHAHRYGVKLDPVTVQQGFVKSFSQQPPLAFPAHKSANELRQLEYEWWRRLVAQVLGSAFTEAERFESFFAEVFEFFRGGAAWRIYDDVLPTLVALRARGLRLAVVSNFDSRLDDLLGQLRLDDMFEAVHISSRIGAAKPDPAIFQAALRWHGLTAQAAVHVGDSLREDGAGAQAAGVRAFLIDRRQEHSSVPTHISLSNLQQLLERL